MLPCRGALVYSEDLNGDFSNNYLNPTPVVLGAGDNVLEGALTGFSLDMDLFTVTVPDGLFLSALRVTAFLGGAAGSFMGVQPRAVLDTSPSDYIQSGMGASIPVGDLNYVLIGSLDASTNRDVLPQLVVGAPLNGTSPLPAGPYAFWLNETGAGSTYTLTFEVVPEPGTGGLLCGGFLAAVGRRRR